MRAEFEHGTAQTFDLVVGADGIHSRVRRLAFGPERDYVHHLGYYYCVAGAPGWGHDSQRRERLTARAWSAPGRMAARGGSKGSHLYLFASPELDYDRGDVGAQQRLIAAKFAHLGGEVPSMLAELDGLDGFYLDAIAQVRMDGRYTSGRVALVGDAGYGNTLGGFGTGLAVVGAYVLAGELAVADGDHETAYTRYDEIMRRYAKIAGNTNTGRFLAPKTAVRHPGPQLVPRLPGVQPDDEVRRPGGQRHRPGRLPGPGRSPGVSHGGATAGYRLPQELPQERPQERTARSWALASRVMATASAAQVSRVQPPSR